MNSLLLEPPRPATVQEREDITKVGMTRDLSPATSGEPPFTEAYFEERQEHYAKAAMMVYAIQNSSARLCIVTGHMLPFYDSSEAFGWDYTIWLCSTAEADHRDADRWKRLDYFDSHLPLQDVL